MNGDHYEAPVPPNCEEIARATGPLVDQLNTLNSQLATLREQLAAAKEQYDALFAQLGDKDAEIERRTRERDDALDVTDKLMEADELDKLERATLREQLESVNALAREFGYGQGELDDDLAGCLRKSVDRLREHLATANEKWQNAEKDVTRLAGANARPTVDVAAALETLRHEYHHLFINTYEDGSCALIIGAVKFTGPTLLAAITAALKEQQDG